MIEQFGPFSIRNLRPKPARVADNGFTATLLRLGTPVATLDCGHAPGDDDIVAEFVSEAERDFFQRAAATLVAPAAKSDMDPDERFLRDLVESTYHAGRLAVLSRSNTLFRIDGDAPGLWRQVRAPYRPALEQKIRARYPGKEIRFAALH